MELIQLHETKDCDPFHWSNESTNSQRRPDSEWKDTQEERHDNNHILKFFIGICNCGAENLYYIEYARTKNLEETGVERIDLNCPGCGMTKHAEINCDMSTGVKVRILESWSHDIETSGFNNKNLEHELLKLRKENAELKGLQSSIKFSVADDKQSCNKILKLELRLSRMRERADPKYLEDIANQFSAQILYELTRHYLAAQAQCAFDAAYTKASTGGP